MRYLQSSGRSSADIINWADDYTARDPVTGEPTAGSYDSVFGGAFANVEESDIMQLQLDGAWENTDESILEKIQFGFDWTEAEYHSRVYESGNAVAGWGGGNQDVYDNAIFSRESTSGLLDSFSGGEGSNVNFYYDWDYEAGVTAYEEAVREGGRVNFEYQKPGVTSFRAPRDQLAADTEFLITETTYSPYLQFAFRQDIYDLPVSLVAGVRYERTDVTSESRQSVPIRIDTVEGADELPVISSDEDTTVSVDGDYTLWLPNVDLRVDLIEDLVSRFSYSRSVTRPTLSDLRATFTFPGNARDRNVSSGNPDLEPFTADNFDLSVEWYYGESDYVSVGGYYKAVDNFIINRVTDEQLFGLVDPRDGTPYLWRVTRPENFESADLYGWEFAVQHVFGESGFGVLANATLAMGDIDVDPDVTNFQFALTGLSDSYNLVAFYEKYGIQARIAYNYRDEFLSDSGDIVYTEEFGQLDFNIGYVFSGALEGLSIFLEGLNVTGESLRTYHRYREQLRTASQFEPRFNIGLRYKFFGG